MSYARLSKYINTNNDVFSESKYKEKNVKRYTSVKNNNKNLDQYHEYIDFTKLINNREGVSTASIETLYARSRKYKWIEKNGNTKFVYNSLQKNYLDELCFGIYNQVLSGNAKLEQGESIKLSFEFEVKNKIDVLLEYDGNNNCYINIIVRSKDILNKINGSKVELMNAIEGTIDKKVVLSVSSSF
ncbi:hypothetical protein H0A36_09150 [Endozoicomonas sp. SM1973]|uniref:Uncharacterized protein n=1 Tax=Spartinivicinus marinus TaxID=2994442 RepID=A0A853I0P4_9GAMM|nr:hypothetical protein [Spartinivicinus marinus]MCX4028146.1 hypothetical protein [Spartinivicinus marinus]NYZ66179.1 hypothetical protein [Spartinivicinus marinus]